MWIYTQLSSSILQERGYKVSISNSSLSLAQISYCSLLTILISDLFCSTSYRPIHWPSRISNSVIYVLAIFMGSTASTSETERERGKEKEMLLYHFSAWYWTTVFVFVFNVSFLTILVMILMLAVLDVPRNVPPPFEKKSTLLLQFLQT